MEIHLKKIENSVNGLLLNIKYDLLKDIILKIKERIRMTGKDVRLTAFFYL